jgi:cupin 2 domain-containing protein
MKKNIFSKLPFAKRKEIFETLFRGKGVKIERISSLGQVTPDGEWLSERTSEWVLLLKGSAKLRFKKKNKSVSMKSGDYLFIPAHTFHRVEYTDKKNQSVWLAVHMK